jgi:hypothetical protein
MSPLVILERMEVFGAFFEFGKTSGRGYSMWEVQLDNSV